MLVVEDEKRLAAGLKRGLEAEGFAVDVSLDGERRALAGAEHPYDVIVLDVMLPGVNGYRICSTLRDEGNWTPILMLTAKDGEWDEAEALDTGADDYLTKPFSYVVLLARLRALVRRGARARPSALTTGDLVLDPAAPARDARRRRGGRSRPVSSPLLEYLMRHAGDVVSKRDVLDHVWDYDFEGDPNIVEVYVRRLREKVDRPFDRAAIETVRGAGYRLRADGG